MTAEPLNWKIEGKKSDKARLWNEFETGGFMAQKGLWDFARE